MPEEYLTVPIGHQALDTHGMCIGEGSETALCDNWPLGEYFLDGLGGALTRLPQIRRCGSAIALIEDGQQVFAAYSYTPHVQTPNFAELYLSVKCQLHFNRRANSEEQEAITRVYQRVLVIDRYINRLETPVPPEEAFEEDSDPHEASFEDSFSTGSESV